MTQTDVGMGGRVERWGMACVIGTQLNRASADEDMTDRLTHAMTSLTQRQACEQSSKRKWQEAKAAAKGKGTQGKGNAQGKGLSEGQFTL